METKKAPFIDWIIYFAVCIILSFLPVLYIKKLLTDGSLRIEFELYSADDVNLYLWLWMSIFLILFLVIFTIAAKNIKIKKIKREMELMKDHVKAKEQEFQGKIEYYEEEKKVSIGLDKQKLKEIEQNYESQFVNLKKQIQQLMAENEELKKNPVIQSNSAAPIQPSQKIAAYKSETKTLLKGIQGKINELNTLIEFQNDVSIIEDRNEFINMVATKMYNVDGNKYFFISSDKIEDLFQLISSSSAAGKISIIFTAYYEPQIIQLINLLYEHKKSGIEIYFMNNNAYDLLIFENDSFFVHPFKDNSIIFHYFNSNGVNTVMQSLMKKPKTKFEIVTDKLIEVMKKENAVILKLLNDSYILTDDKINKFTIKMQNKINKDITFISLNVTNDEKYFIDEIIQSESQLPF